MQHFIKIGDRSISIEMGCNHPDQEGSTTAGIGCDGNCQNCHWSIATTTIPEIMTLIGPAIKGA